MEAPTSAIERQIQARADRRAYFTDVPLWNPPADRNTYPFRHFYHASRRGMLCGIGVCDSDCPVHHLPHINKAWVPEGARWLPRVMTSSPSTRQHKTSRMPSRGHLITITICWGGRGRGGERELSYHQPPFYYPSTGGYMFKCTTHPPLPLLHCAFASSGSPSCLPDPGQTASSSVRLLAASSSFTHIGEPTSTAALGFGMLAVTTGRAPRWSEASLTENTLPWCIAATSGHRPAGIGFV